MLVLYKPFKYNHTFLFTAAAYTQTLSDEDMYELSQSQSQAIDTSTDQVCNIVIYLYLTYYANILI